MKKLLLLLAASAVVWKLFFAVQIVELGPGVKVANVPKQTKVENQSFEYKNFNIEPLAEFDIEAKVLARKDYYFDQGAKLSPIDLALGWGNMSDESVIQQLKITQSGRWYRWRAKVFPIPRREIETSSANMHMIPASAAIKAELKHTRVGDIIHLKGKLVKITNDQGFTWKSSLTREDTGDGACELIWVESFTIKSD